MRIVRRILTWALGIVAALLLLLVGAVAADGLMSGGRVAALTNTAIPNGSGPEVRAYVARPSTPGPHPAVIMVHEFWGLREDMVGKAEALAREGYVVVAPDVFRGSSASWVPRAIWQVVSTPTDQADADLDAVFAWLASQPDVRPDQIAIMGFCFGGGTSLRYSLHNPDLAATAVLYGSVITEPERLRALPGPLLGIFGGADQSIPIDEVRAFERALQEAGVPSQITVYDGQPHAFIESADPPTAGGAQQEAWQELVTFFGGSLRGDALAPSQIAGGGAAWPGAERAMHLFVCNLTVRT